MKKMILTTGLLLALATAQAEDRPHWGYTGSEGPEHWGQISPAFSICSTGKN